MASKDLVEQFNEFKEVAKDEIINGVKKAMRKAAREIQKQTIENARAGIKTYNNHPNGEYEQDSILDAVRVGKLQDNYDEDEMSIKVHVMGNGRENSKTFRFRFLEKGTKERYATTYKGKPLAEARRLGKIPKNGPPARYFGRAKQSVNVLDIYLQEVEKAIDKVNEG